MVSKVIFVLAAVCLCGALAKPSDKGNDNIQALSNQVTAVFDTLNTEFKKVFDIKETKESKQIVENLQTTSNELAGKLSTLLEGVNKEVKAHSGDAGKAFESFKTKVSEAAAKLKEAHPAEAAKAQEYQKQIEETLNSLATKANEAASAIAKDTSGLQEDFHKFTENVMKEVKTNAEKLSAEFKKTLDEHAKEHKH